MSGTTSDDVAARLRKAQMSASRAVTQRLPEAWCRRRWVRKLVALWDGGRSWSYFEGRSFPAPHHHISAVLCCYAFVVAERVRRFGDLVGSRQ